jgi:hypothetical protein
MRTERNLHHVARCHDNPRRSKLTACGPLDRFIALSEQARDRAELDEKTLGYPVGAAAFDETQ